MTESTAARATARRRPAAADAETGSGSSATSRPEPVGAGTSGAAGGAGEPADGADASAVTADVATYELARDELAAVVHKLESGGLGLDESLTLWERGEHLAAVCSRFLDNARERVESALARAERE